MSLVKRFSVVTIVQTTAFDAIAQRRALDLQKGGSPRTVAVGLLQCPADEACFVNPKAVSEGNWGDDLCIHIVSPWQRPYHGVFVGISQENGGNSNRRPP